MCKISQAINFSLLIKLYSNSVLNLMLPKSLLSEAINRNLSRIYYACGDPGGGGHWAQELVTPLEKKTSGYSRFPWKYWSIRPSVKYVD